MLRFWNIVSSEGFQPSHSRAGCPRYVFLSIAAVLILCGLVSAAESKFPPPEFETGHEFPQTTTPQAREGVFGYIDSLVLLGTLGFATYLVFKKRSRKVVFGLTIFSLLYFGFYREGCICPIGAIQNVTMSFFDSLYAIPIVVLVFFLLPLIFTLFFGRTFCSSVCPLGAIQEMVLLRPVSIPQWLESGLRIFAYLYLGLAILFAATGSAFVICRYDPFVAFFRLSGNANILIFGACFLIIGIFIGRPYCRFLCPLGVIFRNLSRISKWRVTITPDECIKCRLCEQSCPYGAIKKPTEQWPKENYIKSKRLLPLLLVLLPVLIFLGGWAGSNLKNKLAQMHPTVRLAERVRLEETGKVEGTTDASDAFRTTGVENAELYEQASVIRKNLGTGGLILGCFIGLVIGIKLIAVSVWRERTGYEADRASCFACGRCFEYCPIEHKRRNERKRG
ncbi:MAG: 4Fe-4S binding protein [Sedimentisphaerales bacterium]|nr:4Fe-4S binding protein [Sedimentisphaerales bacterium]